jgi:hypothetical protein
MSFGIVQIIGTTKTPGLNADVETVILVLFIALGVGWANVFGILFLVSHPIDIGATFDIFLACTIKITNVPTVNIKNRGMSFSFAKVLFKYSR